jgi:hypothetical protein
MEFLQLTGPLSVLANDPSQNLIVLTDVIIEVDERRHCHSADEPGHIITRETFQVL